MHMQCKAVQCAQRKNRPTLLRTMPAASWPPSPPKLPSRLAFLLAHRRWASRSAYVNPTTLDRLKTSARSTIGRNLSSANQPQGAELTRC